MRAARLFLTGSVMLATAQAPPEFEAASIKRVEYSDKAFFQALPGRLAARNIAARALILIAYDLQNFQLIGSPDWTGSEQYDFQATAAGLASIEQMEGPMLRSLLEERFHLKFHRETRAIAGYELRVSGKPRLSVSQEGSCTPYPLDQPPPPANVAGPGGPTFCGYPRIRNAGEMRTIDGLGLKISDLTKALTRAELHAPVEDQTGLNSIYDFHLTWMTDLNPDLTDGVSLYTALKEQLGLRLEKAKVPVEVMVVDQIERPTAN